MKSPLARRIKSGDYLAMLLYMYVSCALFLQQEPFPFFNWGLYSASPVAATTYEIVFTSTAPGIKLAEPLPLHSLKPQYHQDWSRFPNKIVQRFGALVERDMRIPAPSPEAAMYQSFYADAEAKGSIEQTRLLVENFLVDLPYAQYELVRLRYDPLQYWRDTRTVERTVLRAFVKSGRSP